MILLGSLFGILLVRVCKVSVGDIILILKWLFVMLLLVIDDDGEIVCGIFSFKNINLLLLLCLLFLLYVGLVVEIV